MNQITHYHDGSNVYGSDEEDAADLRQFTGGLMRGYTRPGAGDKELLPQADTDQEAEECQIDEQSQLFEDRKCFKAGQL